MGRGRAKAKQIKVARKLKYSAPETDLSALERELRSSRGDSRESYSPVVDDDSEDDPDSSDDEDYGPWASTGHG